MRSNAQLTYLILTILLETEAEDAVAEAENVLVGCVLGALQLVEREPRPVLRLQVRHAEDLEHLLGDRLLPDQILVIAVRRRHLQLERDRFVLLALVVRYEDINEKLE